MCGRLWSAKIIFLASKICKGCHFQAIKGLEFHLGGGGGGGGSELMGGLGCAILALEVVPKNLIFT